MEAKIVILGDFAPVGASVRYFTRGEREWFTGGLGDIFKESDFRVVNLEAPIIEAENQIQKVGPCLGVKSESARSLDVFSLVGLANNHIMDHSKVGLKYTMKLLDSAGIPHIGAGCNLSEAAQPYIAELNGMRIGFLAWSHHEFCIATESEAGACPIDLTIGLDAVEALRGSCDYVILLYHGGVEHFPYPTPNQRRLCQFLARRGVDLIVCQHSHIIGASEVVGNSTIVYGQGNYCFDLLGKQALEHWNEGLCLKVLLNRGKPLHVDFIPVIKDTRGEMRPMLASGDAAHRLLTAQRKYSEKLADEDEYQKIWSDYAKMKASNFIYEQLPVGRIARKILKELRFLDSPLGVRHKRGMLNRIECEAHADVIVAGLKEILKK